MSEPRARTSDPATSHDAAASITPDHLSACQTAVMRIMDFYSPLTDEMLVTEYDIDVAMGEAPVASPSGIRTRRKELTDLGLIIDTGKKATTRSGRWATLWDIKR